MKKSTWIWIIVLVVFIGGGLLYRRVAQDVDSRGATRLMRALEENDTEKTRQLLESGLDVHARDKSGQTALFYAARHTDDPMLLHKLVVAGADTFAKDNHGFTPLMAAAQQNPSARVVMALARYGRFLEGQETNKNQALGVAAQYNTAEIIRTLLITGANPQEAEADRKNTADLVAENPKLTEQEKTDLRQVMLVLEILEAREKFRQENYPKSAEKKISSPQKELAASAKKPIEKPIKPAAKAELKKADTPSESLSFTAKPKVAPKPEVKEMANAVSQTAERSSSNGEPAEITLPEKIVSSNLEN